MHACVCVIYAFVRMMDGAPPCPEYLSLDDLYWSSDIRIHNRHSNNYHPVGGPPCLSEPVHGPAQPDQEEAGQCSD